MKNILFLSAAVAVILLSAFIQLTPEWGKTTNVSEVMTYFGEQSPVHGIENVDDEKVTIGKELFFRGRSTNPSGKKSQRISKYYTCASCHNTVKEDPDLENPNPASRLSYAAEKNIPFLQGTTLYGVVNRTHWYNGDYKKKYGDLVLSARDTLTNAIQLCAKECSQGRLLEQWELEAFIHYFWSLQLTLGDLNLGEEEWQSIHAKEASVAALVKSKFSPASPATFVPSIVPEERTYGENGNIEAGKIIYTQGCLHCHHPKKRITNLKLEDNKLSHLLLKSMLKKTSEMSVYEIVRTGTFPIAGYKPYMPHYTQERLSDSQIEDLVAYIISKCN